MKIFIMSGIMALLVTVNVQASIIILKDGRNITGDIIQQDKIKVVVKEGDSSLTYFKDEIDSIDGEFLIDTTSDPDKEKLIQQFLDYSPTRTLVSKYVENNVQQDQMEVVLSTLNDDQNITALTKVRAQGLAKYLSSADLKVAINFYSTPEGKQFLKDFIQYQNNTMREFFMKLGHEISKMSVREE